MRIAFVSFETVHHRETKANTRLQTVAKLLRDDGHDVHVLCAQWWDGATGTIEHEGVTYHGVSVALDTGWSFLVRLPFVVTSVGPDAVHATA